MSIKAIDVRRGVVVEYKNEVWTAVDNEKVAKGKGDSFYVIQLRNVRTGQLIKERFRTVDQFETVFVDRKPVEYLYSDGKAHVVMDPETYDQLEIPAELIGDAAVYLTPNILLQVSFIDGKPVTVELPNTVTLEVVDTPPQVKGATATNQLKDAVCDTGAKIKVPPFVENGTKIKVDTRTGEYLGRA